MSLFTVPGLVVLFFANVDKKIELDYKDLVVSDDDFTKFIINNGRKIYCFV